MAKLTLSDIGTLANGSSARQAINDNFTKIGDAINNTLSLDGSLPNSMGADVDLNSHKLLNVADPVHDLDGVNMRSVKPLVDQYVSAIAKTIIEGTARVDTFTATAGQTDFILTDSPGTSKSTFVTDKGIFLIPEVDYTLAGADLKTLSFFAGRNAGSQIVVRYTQLSPTDSALRADLSQGGVVGKGADLIHTSSLGTGAVDRKLKDKIRENLSVKDFGAKGDGVTDDTTAIQNAINYVESTLIGGDLRFPRGVYKITSTLNIGLLGGVSARLIGEGAGNEGNGGGSSDVTTIQWWGATDGIMLQQTGQTAWGAMNICFDGRYRPGNTSGVNMPSDVWRLDRTVSSHFERVRLSGFKATGLHVIPTTVTANDNFMFNSFTNLTVASYHPAATGIALKGNATHTSNCCHNTFTQTSVIHAYHGVYVDDADNNMFVMLRVAKRPEATDPNPWGIILTGSHSRNNYFAHLQTDTLWAATGSRAAIWGYDRENGESLPQVDSGALLQWSSFGNNGVGTTFDRPLLSTQVSLSGDPVLANSGSPDGSLHTILRPDIGARVCWGMVNSPRAVNLYAHASSTPNSATPALSFGNDTLTSYRMGTKVRTTGTAAPTTGTWNQGDTVYTTTPAAGGFMGWVCVTGGTPGTWKTFGAISP